MDHLHINVYVTNQCNRSCDHCYYPRNNNSMDINTADKVARWIANIYRVDEVKNYRIHFLGGEPTLNCRSMFHIIDYVKLLKPDFTQCIPEGSFVCFTNGDFLDDFTLNEFKRRDLKVVLNPSDDDLSVIESKVDKVKLVCGGCSLSISLTDYNLSRLNELIQFALKNKIHARLSRLYLGGTIPGYVDKYRTEVNKALDLLLKSDWIMWPNFIVESTTPTWSGPKNPNFCGRFFLVVDPDGSIRSCNVDLEAKIGHISTHTKMNDFVFPHRWSAKKLDECHQCDWVTWCQGGCPYTRKMSYGTYNHKSPFCEAFKELFPKLMELTRKWTTSQLLQLLSI